jgi:hypothetical protein
MKLFVRTGGHWLFWWSAVYFAVAMLDLFVLKEGWSPWIQIIWLSILALPLIYNPLARWLNMKENHMFDWLKMKKDDKIIPFPEPKPVPYIAPPEPKKEPKTYYTFGLTDDNRVTFTMGYTTLTMTKLGVQNLIEEFEFFKGRLSDEE